MLSATTITTTPKIFGYSWRDTCRADGIPFIEQIAVGGRWSLLIISHFAVICGTNDRFRYDEISTPNLFCWFSCFGINQYKAASCNYNLLYYVEYIYPIYYSIGLFHIFQCLCLLALVVLQIFIQ